MKGLYKNKYRTASTRLKNWDYGSNAAYFITICTGNREHYFGNITEQKLRLNNIGQIANDIWLQIPNQFQYTKLGNFIVMPNHVHGILIINKSNDIDVNKNTTKNDDVVISESETDSTLMGSCPKSQSQSKPHLRPRLVEARLIAPLPNVDASNAPTNNDSNSSSNPQNDTSNSAPESTSQPKNKTFETSDSSSKRRGGITGDKNPMLHQNISRIIRWYKGRCSFEIRKIQADFAWQSRFYDHIIRNDRSFQNISNYIVDNPKNWNTDKFYGKND